VNIEAFIAVIESFISHPDLITWRKVGDFWSNNSEDCLAKNHIGMWCDNCPFLNTDTCPRMTERFEHKGGEEDFARIQGVLLADSIAFVAMLRALEESSDVKARV